MAMAAIASQELGSHLLQGRILALVRPLTGNDGSSTAVHLAQDALAIGCSDFHDLLLGNCCWPLSGGQKNSSFKKKDGQYLEVHPRTCMSLRIHINYRSSCVCVHIYIFIYLFIYLFMYLFIYCSFIYLFIYSFIYFYPQWVISDIWVIKLYINHLLSGICTHPSRFPYHDR